MSKGIKILLLIGVLVTISGYLIYDSVFPVAKAVDLPNIEDIEKIQIENSDIKIDITTEKEMKEIITMFEESKPTRIMSVNESPTVKDYFIVHLSTEDNRMYVLYIYEDKNEWYLEQAYIGVYKLDRGIEDKLNVTN